MSLYVGNLSSRVKQEDLGRAFGRFGRCRVQLKDGYGFAIYESRADAERALRSMRGKYVCGEQVTLGWSNKQPRYAQRLERTARFHEPFRRRIPREESDATGIRGSQDRGDFNTRSNGPPSYNNEGQGLDDALDKKADQIPSDMIDTEGNKDLSGHEPNDSDANGANLMESDRWGEHGAGAVNRHGLENGNGFVCYETYDHSRKDENEKMDSPYESRGRGISREKRWRENSIDDHDRKHDKTKLHQACYACGQVGHIMRNCPAAASQRGRFSKFSRKREELNFGEKFERGLKRSRTGSWGNSDASRDPVITTRHKRDRKESHAEKPRRLTRTRLSLSREENQPKPKWESKKRSKKEHKDPKSSHRRHRARRSRTTTSSQSPRMRTSSHSKPRESNSDSSPSHVKSLSSRSSSASKSSLSRPLSSRSRSRSRSRSHSRSSSRSLSLSVSLGQKQTTPSKDTKVDTSLDTCFKEHLNEGMSLQLESSKINGECSNMEDENPRASEKANIETNVAVMQPVADSENIRDSKFMIDLNKNCSLMESVKDTDSACRTRDQKVAELETTNWNSIRETPMHDASPSARITTKEMFSALRHYGLGASKEEKVKSVEDYFGAACLWPWEMIYYRRSKKGSVSTENYARRLQQNKEFGIVDKYIRSSSGWSEYRKFDT